MLPRMVHEMQTDQSACSALDNRASLPAHNQASPRATLQECKGKQSLRFFVTVLVGKLQVSYPVSQQARCVSEYGAPC